MYYNLRLSYDPKIIGVRNGIYQVELMEELYDKDLFDKFKEYFIETDLSTINYFPNFDACFYFKKLRTAKETDIMSFCPHLNHCQFLIKEDILEILRGFRIQHYKDYPAEIHESNESKVNTHYKMFCSVFQDWEVVDFGRTVFTYGGFGAIPLTEYRFSSKEDFKKNTQNLRVMTLALSHKFDRSLDFFQTRIGGTFVSEKLKKLFEQRKFSGIFFRNEVKVIL